MKIRLVSKIQIHEVYKLNVKDNRVFNVEATYGDPYVLHICIRIERFVACPASNLPTIRFSG